MNYDIVNAKLAVIVMGILNSHYYNIKATLFNIIISNHIKLDIANYDIEKLKKL